MPNKFLDMTGLTYYDSKLKEVAGGGAFRLMARS